MSKTAEIRQGGNAARRKENLLCLQAPSARPSGGRAAPIWPQDCPQRKPLDLWAWVRAASSSRRQAQAALIGSSRARRGRPLPVRFERRIVSTWRCLGLLGARLAELIGGWPASWGAAWGEELPVASFGPELGAWSVRLLHTQSAARTQSLARSDEEQLAEFASSPTCQQPAPLIGARPMINRLAEF